MSKKEEFEFTLDELQQLTLTSLVLRESYPDKFGEKKVESYERAIAKDDAGALFRLLRARSPRLQGFGDDFKAMFGDREDWYPVDEKGKKVPSKDGKPIDPNDDRINGWKMVDPTKTYKLRIDKEALSGVVWCCILRLHADSPVPIGTLAAEMTWWPLARKLGRSEAVAKYIGLAEARLKRPVWEDDPEPEIPALEDKSPK